MEALLFNRDGCAQRAANGRQQSVKLRHLTNPSAGMNQRADRAAWLAEEDIVIRMGIKWRIEISKIDTRIRELGPVAQPLQIVAEIQPIHWTTINQNSRLATKSLSLIRARAKEKSSRGRARFNRRKPSTNSKPAAVSARRRISSDSSALARTHEITLQTRTRFWKQAFRNEDHHAGDRETVRP